MKQITALSILQNARDQILRAHPAHPLDKDAYAVIAAAIGHVIGARVSTCDAIYFRLSSKDIT